MQPAKVTMRSSVLPPHRVFVRAHSFSVRAVIYRLCLLVGLLASTAAAHAESVKGVLGAAASAMEKSAAMPQPSASARDLFSRYKDRVAQVRVLRNSANEQSALGSAFAVRDDGAQGVLFITNYHVISSLAVHPEKFRLELRANNERSVKAALIAIDVIHDLALLRAEPAESGGGSAPILALRDKPLPQGERIYSMGNPLEVGFLISEGIYNGLAESRVYDQMIFSGAINSGMSGGPAIDEAGRAVGVNVSTHRAGVLISFLVPIAYVSELLARADVALPRKEWRTEIARQLLSHQQFVAGKLLDSLRLVDLSKPGPATNDIAKTAKPTKNAKAGFASQTLSGRVVPTLDGGLTKCWAGGRDGERPRFQRDTLSCNLQSDLFVSAQLYSGSLRLDHAVLRNDKLSTPQFLAIGGDAARYEYLAHSGNAEKTPQECRNDYVRGEQHVYRVSICVRGLKKYAGLYDFTVSAVQMDNARERLTSTLTLNGLSYDNGISLTGLFLERLQ
jgi:serine protease Do